MARTLVFLTMSLFITGLLTGQALITAASMYLFTAACAYMATKQPLTEAK